MVSTNKEKLVLFITFCILVALVIVGAVVLMIAGIDVESYFIQIGTLLGLVVMAAGQFWSLGKQATKIKTIEENTNGRLTARDQEIRRLTDLLAAQGIDPNDPATSGITVVPAAEVNAAYGYTNRGTAGADI